MTLYDSRGRERARERERESQEDRNRQSHTLTAEISGEESSGHRALLWRYRALLRRHRALLWRYRVLEKIPVQLEASFLIFPTLGTIKHSNTQYGGGICMHNSPIHLQESPKHPSFLQKSHTHPQKSSVSAKEPDVSIEQSNIRYGGGIRMQKSPTHLQKKP